MKVANRILEQIKRPMDIDGEAVSVTVSIGIADLDGMEEPSDPKGLVNRSDQASLLRRIVDIIA